MTTLAELRDGFVLNMEQEGLSPRTVELYLTAFDQFAGWIGDTPVDKVTGQDVQRWIVSLETSQTTRAIRYNGLRAVFKWVVRDQELERSPFEGLKPPKIRYEPPAYPSDEDIEKLIDAAEDKKNPDRIRDAAMIRFTIDTGVRLGELASLTVDRIDYKKRQAVVTGKTGTHTVRFTPATAVAIERWVRQRRKSRWADLPDLWLGQRGPMTDSGITQRFETLFKAAGVQGRQHLLRHRAAAMWLKYGGSTQSLEALMGWRPGSGMASRYGAITRNETALDEADVIFERRSKVAKR